MATIHNEHKGEAILYDGCPRCEEHAADPFADLDDGHFDGLIRKIEEKKDDYIHCTEVEYIAMQNIKRVMWKNRRITQARDRIALLA